MNAKHTPGPWKIVDNEPLQIGGNWRGHYYDKVCTIEPRRFQNVPVDTGNARLIAAAPDMLAALEQILDADGDLDAMDFNQIRAAIARAKGEA